MYYHEEIVRFRWKGEKWEWNTRERMMHRCEQYPRTEIERSMAEIMAGAFKWHEIHHDAAGEVLRRWAVAEGEEVEIFEVIERTDGDLPEGAID